MDQATQVGPERARIAPDATPNLLLSALPPDWRLIGRSRFGIGGPIGVSSGCHALANPAIGIALVDVAPATTPNAEARLRRALAAENFWQDFPGTLPVWHGRIELGEVRALPNLLAEGFGTLPSLTLPGREGWMAAVQAALALDEGWDVPGQARSPRALPAAGLSAPTDAPLPTEEDIAPEPRRRPSTLQWAGATLGGLALVALLLLLAGGPAPAPEPVTIFTAIPPEPAPAAPQVEASVLPPIERVTLPPLPAPIRSEPAPEPLQAEPQQAEPRRAEPEREATAMLLPTPPVQPAPAPASAVSPALALPPPAPPPAPPLRRASAPPRIDAACTRAVFRYQQGLALTATEAAHVRNGCATRR